MTSAPGSAPDLVLQQPAATAEKKRRRPALSCEQCRRRKIRCDRNLPCKSCIKLKIPSCTYAPTHVPKSRTGRTVNHSHVVGSAGLAMVPGRSAAVGDHAASWLTDTPPAAKPLRHLAPSPAAGLGLGSSTVHSLTVRIQELERQLADAHQGESLPKDKLLDDSHYSGEESAPMKGTNAKIRFFGQSHWMNGPDMFPEVLSTLMQAEARSIGPYRNFIKCKTLARTIKEHRAEPLSSTTLGQTVPAKALADQLVNAYFANFEGAIRILHVPTFRAEYERYWLNPVAANLVFVIQMQLCMALGASVHDNVFSLRATAVKWVHEAQLWLILPPEKNRMTIAGIQILCLLSLCKAACAVGQDLGWVATGSIVRRAICMGLHRDPSQLAQMTVYRAEMRRRLWATILELNLQASFDAGNPPLLSPKHHDVLLPANLNDDQLTDEADSRTVAINRSEELTEMSAQLLLLRSHTLRREIIKHVTKCRGKDSYPETLRLSSELTKSCHTLTRNLVALTEVQKLTPRAIINQFHCRVIQLMVFRCFTPLHQPMLRLGPSDPTMYYSRKVLLDSSLKIIEICNLSRPGITADAPGLNNAATAFDRLIVTGSGVFRVVPLQALLSIGMEFIHMKEEERDLLATTRSKASNDLRPIVEASIEWAGRRIRAGETTIKIHSLTSAGLVLADAIDKGLSSEQIEQSVFESGEKSSIQCWEYLKEVAGRDGVKINEDDGSPAYVEEPIDTVDMTFDWLGDFGWDGVGEWSVGM